MIWRLSELTQSIWMALHYRTPEAMALRAWEVDQDMV